MSRVHDPASRRAVCAPRRVWAAIVLLALWIVIGTSVPTTQAQAPLDENMLQVTEVIPADGSSGVPADTAIVVIFNRPVVPLMSAAEMAALPSPITLSPAAQGAGEWVNTSIYTFRPEPSLMGGGMYTVTVDPNLTAVDGSTLGSPFSWTFTTTAPSVTEINPVSETSGFAIDGTIQIAFSQPVSRESAETAFYLRSLGLESGTLLGQFEWTDDSTGFRFTPDQPLDFAEAYQYGFAPGRVTSAGGGAPIQEVVRATFTTVPLPSVIQTQPFDGQSDAYPYGGFTIYFASPMEAESLRDLVVIDPTPATEYDTYYNGYDNSFTINFPSEPSTNYTVTINPGAQDVYGNEITTTTVVRFTTRPFDPDVSLRAPSGIGFYNANNSETRVFLTHRNVSRIDLDLYRVNTQEFLNLVTGDFYYDPTAGFNPQAAQLLRSWSIPSNTPLNVRRYELLNLGESIGESPACEGAPVSRIRLGDQIGVITDAVRIRSTPPDGEIIEVVYENFAATVTGGPTCANSYLWWQIDLPDGRQGWVAEGDLNEYYWDVTSRAAETPVEVTDQDGSALEPGVYFLRASSPETSNMGLSGIGHFLVVGTTNLTLKVSPDEVWMWATDVSAATPLADLPVTLYDDNLNILSQTNTDSNGFLQIETPRVPDLYVPRVAVVDSGDQFGIGLSAWSDGIDGYLFGVPTDYYPEPNRTYVYTDRPIYRPGQPVYFRGIVRQRDDVSYTPLPVDSIPVQIYDNEGSVVFEGDLPLTPYGSFNGTFEIAADAALGYYRIAPLLPGEDPAYYGRSGSVSFMVAEYRAPEFQVTVTPEADEVVQGDTIRALVDSRYFFGGVVSGAEVDYTVVAQPYYFTFDDYRYSFSDFDFDSGASEFYAHGGGEVATGTGTTDANGQFMIEVPADLEDSTQSLTFNIEATVMDESGQGVVGRASVIVHKGLIYVGVAPEYYVSTAGEETKIDVLTLDWAGEPVANQTVQVSVVERRWSSVQETDEFGRSVWTSEVESIPVTEGEVTTDANGEAVFSFVPPSGGIYKVTTTVRDSVGNEVVSAATIWVSGSNYVLWRQQNSNRIDLIADQTDYEIGDTAEILITSPFQGAVEGVITVERGGVLFYERITLDSNSFVYQLPITEDYAPNAFVSVLLIKGVDENNPVAAFRMGMTQIAVDNARREITLSVDPSVEQAGPGDTVQFTVRAEDFAGAPVQAEVGIGLTDLAVLTLRDDNTMPLLPFFYGTQGLSVRTATPLTINVDEFTQVVLDTIKGGGGGGGEGGIFDIREEFVDTPYWNAELVTDANGEATFEVTLPDNLTTWRLDARAVTSGADGDMLVGDFTLDLLSTKPLLIRPITPRFFVAGDQVTLAAIVNNNSDQTLEVQVDLQAAGVTFADAQSAQNVTIEAGQRARVEWNVTINDAVDVSTVDLTFFASAGDLTDASKPPLGQGDARLLPVYRYEVPETTGTGGVLQSEGAVSEVIALPTALPVTQGDLSVRVEPSLLAAAFDGLEALKNFPHQGVEQTVSTLFANTAIYRALNGTPLMTDELRRDISAEIGAGLQRLYAWQKVDGGWGWFVRDPSSPTITAYALIGLVEAREQGFTVNSDVIAGAVNFLRGTFIVPGFDTPNWQLNRQALVLYALTREGQSDVARAANLYDNRERLAYYGQALLAITVAGIDGGNARADVLLDNLISSAVITSTGVQWQEPLRDAYNWNTDTRTTAMVLHALVRLRPQSDLIPNVIRWLQVARTADAWTTTQETAWALLALTDYAVVTGDQTPTYSYAVALNGAELASGEAPTNPAAPIVDTNIPVADLQPENTFEISRGAGAGSLYYTAFLRNFLPVDQVEPLNRGVIVERRYTLQGDESQTPITEARVGDVVDVRLTIIAPNDLHYVIVEDPIPAGTDAVNPELNTSSQIGTQPEINRRDPLSQGWGWWWFSNIEFRDDRVVMYSTFLPAGTYEYRYSIRVGLEGVYSVIPATAYEAYFPDVYGRSAGTIFTINPAGE